MRILNATKEEGEEKEKEEQQPSVINRIGEVLGKHFLLAFAIAMDNVLWFGQQNQQD